MNPGNKRKENKNDKIFYPMRFLFGLDEAHSL
jgi:hypothetical protein